MNAKSLHQWPHCRIRPILGEPGEPFYKVDFVEKGHDKFGGKVVFCSFLPLGKCTHNAGMIAYRLCNIMYSTVGNSYSTFFFQSKEGEGERERERDNYTEIPLTISPPARTTPLIIPLLLNQ